MHTPTRLTWAFIIIILSAAALLVFGLINRNSVAHYHQMEIDRIADVTTVGFQTTIESYLATLYGVRGLMSADNETSRLEFHQFVASLEIPRRLPGVTAIAYAKLISPAERAAFIEAVQNDTQLELSGYPQFTIRPERQTDQMLVLTYVEPSNLLSSKEALGFDLLSDQNRATTFELARDTNRAFFSPLVTAAGTGAESYILFLPVFDETEPVVSTQDRQTTVRGAVTMSLQRTNLFSTAFQLVLEKNPGLRIRVFEGPTADDAALVYDSNNDVKVLGVECCAQVTTQERTFDRAGRTWTITYSLPSQSQLLTVPYFVLSFPLVLIIGFSILGLVVHQQRIRSTSI